MSLSYENGQCLICHMKYSKMVSLNQSLRYCKDLTVAQVLKSVHFFSISGATNSKMVCFICVSKLQTCYKLKALCTRMDIKTSKAINNKPSELITVIPFLLPLRKKIKQEKDIEDNNEKVSTENLYGIEINTKIKNTAQIPAKINHYDIKTEIDIDEGIVDSKNKGKYTKLSNNLKGGSRKISNASTYICPVCQKGFKSINYFSQHYFIHTDIKPRITYRCDLCSRTFAVKNNLKKHKLTHGDEKRYVCDVCYEKFLHSYELLTHKMVHDNHLYYCSLCSRSFPTKIGLSKHKFIHKGTL